MARHAIWVPIMVASLAAGAAARSQPYDPVAHRAIIDAKAAIERGELKLFEAGQPRPAGDRPAARRLLAAHLDLHFEDLGCDITAEQQTYMTFYNDAVRRHVELVHGPGVIEAAADEARLMDMMERARTQEQPDFRRAGAVVAGMDFKAGRHLYLRLDRARGIDVFFDDAVRREFGVRAVVFHERADGLASFLDGYNDSMRQRLVRTVGAEHWHGVVRKAVLAAAEHDIADGRLVVMTFGGPPGQAEQRHQQLLRERLGVEVMPLGCVLPTHYEPRVYQQRMREEIERRFGAGILDELEREAREGR